MTHCMGCVAYGTRHKLCGRSINTEEPPTASHQGMACWFPRVSRRHCCCILLLHSPGSRPPSTPKPSMASPMPTHVRSLTVVVDVKLKLKVTPPLLVEVCLPERARWMRRLFGRGDNSSTGVSKGYRSACSCPWYHSVYYSHVSATREKKHFAIPFPSFLQRQPPKTHNLPTSSPHTHARCSPSHSMRHLAIRRIDSSTSLSSPPSAWFDVKLVPPHAYQARSETAESCR